MKTKKNNSRRIKKLVVLTMALSLLFSMPVMAAEKTDVVKAETNSKQVVLADTLSNIADTAKTTAVTPRASGIYGYAAGYIGSSTGSFTVNATGTGTSTGGLSIKTHGFSSSSVQVEVTLRRPDGSAAKTVILTGNTMKEDISFSNAPSGTYTVSVAIHGTPGGYVSTWVFSM